MGLQGEPHACGGAPEPFLRYNVVMRTEADKKRWKRWRTRYWHKYPDKALFSLNKWLLKITDDEERKRCLKHIARYERLKTQLPLFNSQPPNATHHNQLSAIFIISNGILKDTYSIMEYIKLVIPLQHSFLYLLTFLFFWTMLSIQPLRFLNRTSLNGKGNFTISCSHICLRGLL